MNAKLWVFIAIFVSLGLNLSPTANAAWGDWKNKIAEATAKERSGRLKTP